MGEAPDLTIEILKQIRDEMRRTREDLGARIDATNERIDRMSANLGARIDATNDRLETVEGTLLELAEQQRFVVRHLKSLGKHDDELQQEVLDLRVRVQAIEARLGPSN